MELRLQDDARTCGTNIPSTARTTGKVNTPRTMMVAKKVRVRTTLHRVYAIPTENIIRIHLNWCCVTSTNNAVMSGTNFYI